VNGPVNLKAGAAAGKKENAISFSDN